MGYGMAETIVAARGFNTESLHNYSSVGLLDPNMEAKVVDVVTGVFKGPDSMGELWLRGPSIMKGYLNNVEATTSTIDKEGWLHTGDICYFDKNGYLYIIERVKEIIKCKGFQVNYLSPQLNCKIILKPQKARGKSGQHKLCRVRDEEAGEVPVAFVVKNRGSGISEAAPIDYVAKQVAPYKKLRRVEFTDSIPRSAVGKILRRELRKFFPSKL